MLSVAWLITSMYTLPWYDLIAWMPLAVLAASKLDRIMLLRITALSLAYVPGRAIDVGPALDFTATRMRDTISPIIQIAVLVAVVMWWRKPDRPELFPFGPGRRTESPVTGPRPRTPAPSTAEPSESHAPPATPVRQRRQGRDPTGRDDSEDQGRSGQAPHSQAGSSIHGPWASMISRPPRPRPSR